MRPFGPRQEGSPGAAKAGVCVPAIPAVAGQGARPEGKHQSTYKQNARMKNKKNRERKNPALHRSRLTWKRSSALSTPTASPPGSASSTSGCPGRRRCAAPRSRRRSSPVDPGPSACLTGTESRLRAASTAESTGLAAHLNPGKRDPEPAATEMNHAHVKATPHPPAPPACPPPSKTKRKDRPPHAPRAAAAGGGV